MGDEPCDVQPGRWYLCGVCLTCQEPIPLMQVLSSARRGGDETFVFKGVLCPKCGTRHNYPLSEAVRLRAAGQAKRSAVLSHARTDP
jgi:hypothetical protein